MAEKLVKANILGVEIHLLKINKNGQKANRDSLGRRQKGGGAALPADPEKDCTDKRKINNVDHQIEASTGEKNMHERMTPDEF